MRVEPQQLKSFLLDAGMLTEKQFDQAQAEAEKNKKTVEEILVERDFVPEEKIIKLSAYILGIPFVDLEKEAIDPKILKMIPEPIARAHSIVAFRKRGQDLEVAMIDPEDLRTIEFIKKTTSLRILPRLTSQASIKKVLRQYQQTLEAEFGDIIKKEAGGIKHIKDEDVFGDKNDLQKIAEDLPIIKIVDTLMKHAILQRTSDIHIEPTDKEVLVRYRIDGILRDAMVLPKMAAQGIVARIKVLSNLKLDEHRLPQDGRFKIESEDYKYSVRVSILPVFDGEKIVMRLLPETSKALSLEQLGLRGKQLDDLQDALRKPVGILLVTGPTGSGKTTSLYSMMEILNSPGVNISTIEDPVEYRMPRINQTQVNAKIGMTFASGLRSLLRQDPNVIMVGEIRDNETASLAVNASLTGHLVLSTLHTNSAAGSLPRLIDMKIEPFLIASTLNCILAQRLVRKLCEEKEKYFLKEAEIKDIGKYCDIEKTLDILKKEKIVKASDKWTTIPFYRPKPSKDSLDGYSGRVGIYEVLPVTETIKDLIISQGTSDQIEDRAKKEGMITMFEDGFIKAALGLTSIEEVMRVIID
ncbi:MAG: GspE/PulE family protein [Candidatus Paceibacterota bacterium]|jgi:type IV pilus assembly protein PilB|nr:GspE/PulE family protein [Candidatus Paceibacterota bacterium]MDD4831084.1 GspE/PulE family protein [Candidatus Paceibacterota bacterium]